MKRFLLYSLALLSLIGCAPRRTHAQFIGYQSPQTVTQPALNGATSPTVFSVSNLGQNMHFLSYTKSGSIGVLLLRIEGSNDGITFFPISDDATDITTNAGVIFAVGYYPVVRVNLIGISGGGSITANYTGTSASSSPPVGSYTSGLQARKMIFTRQSMGSGAGPFTVVTPYGNSAGYILLTAEGGTWPAGSTLTVNCNIGNSGLVAPLNAVSLTGLNQLGPSLVPTSTCATISVSYTSGGASANLFSAWYIFTIPGQFYSPTAYKTATATAAGNTAVWTPAAAKRFILQGVCVDVTANASLAAAGIETVDLQDNTTSTGITFSVFINNAAAVTGPPLFSQCIPSMGNGLVSSTLNNVLNVNLSTALATGAVRVRAYGFEQ